MSSPTLTAILVTPAAREWLDGGRPARVLHVFQDACNLIDDTPSVLSIQSTRIPPAPNCLVLSETGWPNQGFVGSIRAGDPVQRRGDQLRLGKLTVAWDEAELWDPRPPWESLRQTRGVWQKRLGRLRQLALTESPAGGISGLLAEAVAPGAGHGLQGDFVEAARAPTREMVRGLRTGDRGAVEASAAELAGLGSGLTPSGDDYLVGVMHALWASQEPREARASSEVIVRAAAPRTTSLSAEWLQAAGRGEAAAYWHVLLEALEQGSLSELERAAQTLLQVGHSSGSDALTGFLQCLQR